MKPVDPYRVPLLYGAMVPQDKTELDQTKQIATLQWFDYRGYHVSSFDLHRRRDRVSESAKSQEKFTKYFPHVKVDYSLLRFFKDFDKVDKIVQRAVELEAQSDYLFCAIIPVTNVTPADTHVHPLNDYAIKTYIFTIDDKTKPWVVMNGQRYEAESDEVLVITMDGQNTKHSLEPTRDDEIVFCVLFEEHLNATKEVTATRIKKDQL